MLPSELRERLDLDGLTIEPTHLTDDVFKDRIADVIYRVPIKETEHHVDFFVILEHKSYNDLWTIFQLWTYVFLVIQQEYRKAENAGDGYVAADYRLPPVIAIILHHGESRFTGKTELSELFLQLPEIEKYLPKLQAVLFDLNAIEDDDVPFDPEVPELKLVLMALKIVFRKDAGTTITMILEELDSVSSDPLLRDIVRMIWYYFASSAKYMEHDYSILYDTIKNIVEVEPMSTMLERAKAEGKAEGRAEGKVKWKTEAKVEAVLAVLRGRFNGIPTEVESAVSQMTDPIALDSWAVQAATCQSIDEFARALK